MPDETKPHRIFLLMIALALLGGILFFGLRPKDLTLGNNASWLTDENGIRFRKYSIAFSPALIGADKNGISESAGFSIELAMKPHALPSDGFSILLALDNGDDSRQLVVGQWRTWLIVMNGNDYAHKKKAIKRLAIDTALLPSDQIFITIATDNGGTTLYANGKPAVAKKDVILSFPSGKETRVIVGNSAYGSHSWQGDVNGLAIYKSRLAADAAGRHFQNWAANRHFGYALKSRPLAVYFFNEKEGELARDSAGGAHLGLPPKMRALRRQVLTLPWDNFELTAGIIVDVCLNFIAFIPFGFALAAVLREWGGPVKARALLIAAGLCVITSLLIEITQSWMPSRSSTLLDLLLNSSGGWVGALLSTKFSGRWHTVSLKP